MMIGQRNAEHCPGQDRGDRAFYGDRLLFSHRLNAPISKRLCDRGERRGRPLFSRCDAPALIFCERRAFVISI
jgi:hypothetical protein